MSIKHILALSVIALGIWLNLEVQDAMAKRDIHGWESKQLNNASPALQAGGQGGQVAGNDSPGGWGAGPGAGPDLRPSQRRHVRVVMQLH